MAGGIGALVGGTGVLVGVMGVGVFDGGTGVLVGGAGVFVCAGGIGALVGGTGVGGSCAVSAVGKAVVSGFGVATSSASTASWVNLIKPAVMKKAIIIIVATVMIALVIFRCPIAGLISCLLGYVKYIVHVKYVGILVCKCGVFRLLSSRICVVCLRLSDRLG